MIRTSDDWRAARHSASEATMRTAKLFVFQAGAEISFAHPTLRVSNRRAELITTQQRQPSPRSRRFVFKDAMHV
jgi:hypothetical protein